MTIADISRALANQEWCLDYPAAFDTPFSSSAGSPDAVHPELLDYFDPLPAWRRELLNDASEVNIFIDLWSEANSQLQQMQASISSKILGPGAMRGKSIRALRRANELLHETAADAEVLTHATATALTTAQAIVAFVRDAIDGAIVELGRIAAAALSTGSTAFNPAARWQAIQRLVNQINGFVARISDLIRLMFKAFSELSRLLESVIPLIDDAGEEVRRLSRLLVNYGERVHKLLLPVLDEKVARSLNPLLLPIHLYEGVQTDLEAPTPDVFEVDIDDLVARQDRDPTVNLTNTRIQRQAFLDALETKEFRSITDFVWANGLTDSIGQKDRTVIDVRLVEGTNGREHWVVSLPSTQDWNILKPVLKNGPWEDMAKDYPTAADLHSNLALMLVNDPERATPYQRGVYEAMRQAGVPAGAPVVYTGFSQGGIMSANLASDPLSPYNTIGIVTTGAPVDSFDIPESVEVVAFGHAGDFVANLDQVPDYFGGPLVPPTHPLGFPQDDRQAVVLPDPVGLNPDGTEISNHSTPGYAETIGEWERQNPREAQAAVDLLGGEVVDHHVYRFVEADH